MTPPTISPSRSIPSVVYGGQTAKPRRSDTKRATASPSINRIGHFIGQFGADDLVIEGLGRTACHLVSERPEISGPADGLPAIIDEAGKALDPLRLTPNTLSPDAAAHNLCRIRGSGEGFAIIALPRTANAHLCCSAGNVAPDIRPLPPPRAPRSPKYPVPRRCRP